MIKEKIEISVYNSYTIADWEKAVIQRCIDDNPSSNAAEMAERLGISDVTFNRKCRTYGLIWGHERVNYGPESFINNGPRKQA